MKKVGWIGIGNMGNRMARRVLDAGYELYLFDINRKQMRQLEKDGAKITESPAKLAKIVDFIFSTIPDSKVLRAITFGETGIAAGIMPRTIFTDISTVDAGTSAEVAKVIEAKGAKFLRCPVSGSTIQAASGMLMVMTSGDKDAFDEALSLLKLFGEKIYYIGKGEDARIMKLVVNMMIGTYFQSYAEALALGEKAGLDWKTMIEVLSESSVSSVNMRNKADRFKERDFSPMATVKTQLKDMNLIMDLARELNVPIPVTTIATQYYNAMVSTGRGDLDYSAILLVNEENCGIKHED